MIGILVQLAISWLIVWVLEKRNLSVLGFWPNKERLAKFFLYFFITAFICSTGFLLKMYFGKQQWQLNPDLSANLILTGILWNIKSVLFEELIFRGVLLYILIKKLGAFKAILFSAISFGIYHWFTFGVFGNLLQMLIAFISTGAMGLLLAYAYSKTFSLYIPIGIHLGWNLITIFIFSQGPVGNGLLIPSGAVEFRTNSYFFFFIATFLPMLLALLTNYLLLRKQKQVKTEIKTAVQNQWV